MTSKSPVRSCRDMDETALSYAEIKALCAGNPLIKEKMDLDIEVARLTILKKDHESQQFRLEDDVLTRFPEEIKKNEGFIAGFQADMATVEAHPHPENGFAGMTLRGDTLTDKDNAGAALLAACKEVTSLDPVEIGSYRGFSMLLAVQNFGHDYVLTLKGEMTHRVTLGKDAKGNFTRIDNALAGMPQRLEGVRTALENLKKQMEEAKAEIGKPFPQEALLREKSTRLAEVNALLNIGGDAPERDAAKSDRASVLAKLKQPLPPPQRKQEPVKPKPRRPER